MRKKTERFLRFIVSFAIVLFFCTGSILSIRAAVPIDEQADHEALGMPVIHEEEFGGVYAGLTIEEFNNLGFSYGDSVTVSFSNGFILEDIPYYNGYYTITGEPLVVAYPGYPYIKVCINNGEDLWITAGLQDSDMVDIILHEKGKYQDIQEARDISYKDDRELYPNDEVFANFRNIQVGNIANGVLYRSASPCDNSHNRAPYTDTLIETAGVRCILDLADTPEKVQGYISEDDFASPYFLSLYEEGHVLPIALNMNYASEEFRVKLANGLSSMVQQEGPYLVHCTEGKDRTGFVCMLLEALCGASYQEIVDDYMITYANYYGITKDSDPVKYKVIVENVLNPMIQSIVSENSDYSDQGLENIDLSQYARDLLLSAGMEETQVLLLIEQLTTPEESESTGDIMILYTSDVHCGIAEGFGYIGLQQVRDTLEEQGYVTILVDDGDAIQGEALGTLTKGEAIITLMNDLKYDVAIPGNHEFDYGVDTFLELADKADYPYISCNFNKEGELVFPPYVIIEAGGIRIAFVGVTTPTTISSSVPAYFQDENGKFIYDFMADDTGAAVYDAVQSAVDNARAQGADYVYVIGHMGNEAESSPWTYADVISHTNGIDVFLDGHSHDTDQVVMKNKDGHDVVRSAVGTKMNCIGYSHINSEEGIVETNIFSWPNKSSAPDVLGITNSMTEPLKNALNSVKEELSQVIGTSRVDLTICDPKEVDGSGNPVRMVRRAETNLGDFCADAIRIQTGADVGLINGGGIRTSLSKGNITYGDVLTVFPYNNTICVIEVTGQQLLDALEWGAKDVPGEFGGFFQVSGITYEIDTSAPSGCIADDMGMLTEIEGERRIRNVRIGDESVDPGKKYTVAGLDYFLLHNGNGNTEFDGANVITRSFKIDMQAMIDYIIENLDGEIGQAYADPYGAGRITID